MGIFNDFFRDLFVKKSRNRNIVLERARKDAAKWDMPYDELYYEYMKAWQQLKNEKKYD